MDIKLYSVVTYNEPYECACVDYAMALLTKSIQSNRYGSSSNTPTYIHNTQSLSICACIPAARTLYPLTTVSTRTSDEVAAIRSE